MAAGNQGDLVHRVVVGQEGADERVPGLMVGDEPLGGVVRQGTTLETRDDAVGGVVHLVHADLLGPNTG